MYESFILRNIERSQQYGTGNKSLAFGTIEFLRIPRSTHCIKYFSKVIHYETSSL